MTKLRTRIVQMAVATVLATGLLAVALADSADATVPGKDGVIAFESNRTTGKGVYNPTGDTEIFTVRDGNDEVYTVKADGSGARNITQKPSNPDQNPSWQ